MIYGSWNIRCDRQKFSRLWAIFLSFQSLDNLENQNFNIEKNNLHICTTNGNHMMYGSWDMERDRPNFLSFWIAFCSFTPPQSQNFKKNGKNTWKWRYYHFTNINDSHMMYGSSDMECNRQNFLSFWTIFCPFNSLTTQKIKI